ncbi:hypothetical protein GCM10008901_01550 [Bifidobacterium pullorum]
MRGPFCELTLWDGAGLKTLDDALIAGFALNEDEKRALMGMAMPIVSVNASDLTYCQMSIAIDDESSEAQIVRYLAALGHRRFCYIGRADPISGDDWGFDARPRGYQDEIAELGLQDCGMIFIDVNDRNAIRQAVASLVSMPDRPTAICTWADQLALPVIHDLEAMGLRVPGDISVFGFDGSDMAAAVNLSTMAQPAREIGRMAARHALNLVDGGTPDEATIVVPTTLEPGGTAGPARMPDNN